MDYTFKGKRLIDAVKELLKAHCYTNQKAADDFGVGMSWYSDFMLGNVKRPNPDVLQHIYETLTGKPLIK